MNDGNQQIPEKKAVGEITTAERRHIFSLSPEDALDAIIDSPHAAELVRSFPEEDFHLLIHEIGIEDSLQLLAMASDEQWTYLLDVETWEQDHPDTTALTRWLNHLLGADPDRLVGRYFTEHLESIELYLFRNIAVLVREEDQDPSEIDDAFFTMDDQFYIRVVDDPDVLESDEDFDKNRKIFLRQFLTRLAGYDYPRYQKILLEVASVIPAETEEEAYRMRNVRLAEKGFLPFDEALGIYQPLKPGDLNREAVKEGIGASEKDIPSTMLLSPVKIAEEGNVFTEALGLIATDRRLEQIQAELAGLSNQIISADRLKIREREQLDDVVKKATGYIGIGLEECVSGTGRIDLLRAVELIERFPLSHIFRIGYGRALRLKWRAEKWHAQSWTATQGLPLGFWGERCLGVLGGLLIKKPLFYDNYRTGVLYREFAARDDIGETESTLDEVIAFDDLLSRMVLPTPLKDPERNLSYKNLVLTLWARHYLGLPSAPVTLTFDAFKSLFRDLWSAGDPSPSARAEMKTSFLQWFSEATGRTHLEITSAIGGVLDRLFEELAHEYGKVSMDHLDPRYIRHFLLDG